MLWSDVVNTFIATMPATIAAITGLIVVIRKLNKIEKSTNGMVERLEVAAKAEGIIEGIINGRAQEVSEEKARVEVSALKAALPKSKK